MDIASYTPDRRPDGGMSFPGGGKAMHVTHSSPSSIPASCGKPEAIDYAAPVLEARPARASDVLLAWIDRNRRRVFIALFVVYLAGFNGQWRLEPDSALYLSIGQNLAERQGYTFHGKANQLAYPGLPVMFAAVFKIFPTRSLIPSLILMLLLGIAALGLVYRLFLLHTDRPTAVMVTLGVAVSRVFYRYCFELLTDLPFLLGVLAFLVGHEAVFERGRRCAGPEADDGATHAVRPRWYDWALLVGGLAVAVATRPAMWALVLAVIAAMLWSMLRGSVRRGQVLVCVAVIAAVVVFYIRRHAIPPGTPASSTYVEEDQFLQPTRDGMARMLSLGVSNIPQVFDRTLARAVFGMALGRPINFALNLTIIALGIALVRVRPVWGLLVATTLAMVLMVPKPQDRYFLPVIPLLVFAWWKGIRWLNHYLPGRWSNAVFLLLFAVGGVPNGAEVIGFFLEQHHPSFLQHYKEGRYASVDKAASMIKQHTPRSAGATDPKTAWVLVPPKFARIVTFLGRRYAIEPDDATPLDPYKLETWRAIFVLEPTESQHPEPGERRPSARKWLADHKLEVVPTVVASVQNRDPDATQPWTLHRVRPIGTSE